MDTSFPRVLNKFNAFLFNTKSTHKVCQHGMENFIECYCPTCDEHPGIVSFGDIENPDVVLSSEIYSNEIKFTELYNDLLWEIFVH